MTPLAQKYFGQLTLPVRDRARDPASILRTYEDLTCFETSAIFGPIDRSISGKSYKSTLYDLPGPFFLPSPVTWIEYAVENDRQAYMLVEKSENEWVMILINQKLTAFPLMTASVPNALRIDWQFNAIYSRETGAPMMDPQVMLSIFTQLLFMLDVINTPSLIRVVDHDPHAGFARKMARIQGGYNLRPWHEITIDPDAVKEVSNSKGYICGKKCLHFVRKHRRRYQDGKEILVASHWRGDAQIGILRSRYRVASLRDVSRKFIQGNA